MTLLLTFFKHFRKLCFFFLTFFIILKKIVCLFYSDHLYSFNDFTSLHFPFPSSASYLNIFLFFTSQAPPLQYLFKVLTNLTFSGFLLASNGKIDVKSATNLISLDAEQVCFFLKEKKWLF